MIFLVRDHIDNHVLIGHVDRLALKCIFQLLCVKRSVFVCIDINHTHF